MAGGMGISNSGVFLLPARVSCPGLVEERPAGGHVLVRSSPGWVTTPCRHVQSVRETSPQYNQDGELAHTDYVWCLGVLNEGEVDPVTIYQPANLLFCPTTQLSVPFTACLL
jgi:hypothetical protein